MPLSELLYMLAGKFDSSSTSQDKKKKKKEDDPPPLTPLFSLPENDVVELVWENGQVQPSRGGRTQVSQSHVASGTNPRLVKLGYMEPVSPQVPLSVSALEIGLNHDDDLVPWLNFPIDEPLQHEYCSEILQDMSGVTVNASSSLNDFASSHRSSGCHFSEMQNGLSSDKERFRSSVDIEAARPGSSSGHLYASQSHQIQTSYPSCTSRVWGDVADLPRVTTATRDVMSKDSTRFASSRDGFPEMTTQNQASAASNTNFQRMNFSHFARPTALVKANAKTITSKAGSGLERIPCTGNPSEPSLVDSCSGLQQQTNSRCHLAASSQLGPDLLETRPAIEPGHCELQKAVSQEDDSKNDNNCCGTFDESNTKGLPDCDKTAEPVVASSVCSGNSVERASDNLRHKSKRKHHDVEESEGPSEDIDEESMGAKIAAPARATSAKRSRAAEVHNLSERRRRDRINEKMRALQELIPNCNKVDKASMLDEAIEYLKTLQLQVQIMSMGAGLYMPSMMLPPGMPLMHAAHMARLSNAGVGMGMAMGFGMGMPDMNGRSSACSMIQAPPMSGSHFPGPPMPGLNGLGFGLSVPGLPVPYACAPFVPVCGGPMMNTYMEMNAHGLAGLRDKLQSTPASISKESILNTNSQGMQNDVANGSVHHTSAQGQETNECCEQSARIENTFHAIEVTSNDSLELANVNGPAEPLIATKR